MENSVSTQPLTAPPTTSSQPGNGPSSTTGEQGEQIPSRPAQAPFSPTPPDLANGKQKTGKKKMGNCFLRAIFRCFSGASCCFKCSKSSILRHRGGSSSSASKSPPSSSPLVHGENGAAPNSHPNFTSPIPSASPGAGGTLLLPAPGASVSPEGYLLPDRRKEDEGRKCLVIDLDETLVHSSFKPISNADFVVPVEMDGVTHQVYVLKRPHVDVFLKKMGEIYECVLFTASLAKYADPVADFLDKWGVFRARLFRESCVFHRGNYVKDLSRLGRNLAHICIVDNSPASYIFHPDNAVPVASWIDDMNDTELLDLVPFLEGMKDSESVYEYLAHTIHPHSVEHEQLAHQHTPSLFYHLPLPDSDSPITQVSPVAAPATGPDEIVVAVTQ
ncbi:unnamed protein product [Cyprideis torosa]|uniref:protein-serine/threonine phosphatase n=1 Tax=Cyprideis torosa TaxID=163714 RepID=A0A7R8WFF7_9CRUS|nr:unnamed protein product [Cyprideis torosa]CAG0891800.1 unnamed protein product [Cyprideis torosa]